MHGFSEPDPLRPIHRVIYPGSLGFEPEVANWSVEFLLSLSPADLQRLARRSLETAGQVETADFLVGLPDPGDSPEDLLQLIDRLGVAFAAHTPLDWLIVIPKGSWFERLSQYHILKAGPSSSASFAARSSAAVSAGFVRLGIPCAEVAPDEILALVSERFAGFTPPALPSTLEGFAAHARDGAMLVTSDPRIFSAWREINTSPLASELPLEWEAHLGKYWHVLGHVMRHLTLNPESVE